jgi:hypothetical protein
LKSRGGAPLSGIGGGKGGGKGAAEEVVMKGSNCFCPLIGIVTRGAQGGVAVGVMIGVRAGLAGIAEVRLVDSAACPPDSIAARLVVKTADTIKPPKIAPAIA